MVFQSGVTETPPMEIDNFQVDYYKSRYIPISLKKNLILSVYSVLR